MKPSRKTERSYFFVPVLMWICFLVVLGFFLFFSEETTIQEIAFSGNESVPSDELKRLANAALEGRYFRIFPRNNFFFFPGEAFIQSLREQYPEIRDIRLERIFPRSVSISIEERPDLFVWRSSSGDFLLREDGRAFRHARLDAALERPSIIVVWDEDGRLTEDGDAVAESNLTVFISEMRLKFESRFGKILSKEVRVSSRFSGELLFHVENGFDMLIDSHRPMDDSMVTLQAALDRGIPEPDRERLARVDLRTENRVYYTVKGE